MKKVCLIIHSLGIGGMERVMHQLVVYFAKRDNLEVHLILIGINREIAYQVPESIIIHKPTFKFKNSRRQLNTIRTIWFLREKVKEIDPNTILSFGEYWNNLVLISLLGLSYPVFISDRSEPGKNLGTIHNYLRNILYPKAAGYIAQTEEAKNVCLSRGWNENIRVIGNPIKQIQNSETIQKENIILTVGRLIKTKHVDQLIKMFAEINQPNWKLVIVGGDAKKMKLSEDLQSQIHKLGVENSVFLEGEQKDVEKYYNKSKIFAFTSSSEGFPNVIGEAMSAGLPVISYDCIAGPSEMISDGKTGFLIPLFDQEKFKERLHQLMMDSELRKEFGRAAKKRIQNYHVERIVDQFHTFITGFTSSNRKVK